MRFSDIKPKHIYIVDFEPVRQCEFNGKHLALVLKRNNDQKTYVVMPLTSEPNGDGVNKIKLGQISTLPPSLRNNDTYAVFNQVRTVNASRFIALKNGTDIVNCYIDETIYLNLLSLTIKDLLFHLEHDEKINLFKTQYEISSVDKAINSAYNIIKLQNQNEHDCNAISSLYKSIAADLAGITYSLTQEQINSGIHKIFDEALNNQD